MANKLIAYLLWLFGGLFGIHHVYLKRDKHAFIYFTTFGGFLVGLLRDLLKIPTYVKDANQDDEFMKITKLKKQRMRVPSFEAARFIGSILVGTLYGYLVQYALPDDYNEFNIQDDYEWAYSYLLGIFYYLFSPIACSLGVYLVNNEGHVKCKFKWLLITSLLTHSILFYFGNIYAISYSAFITSLVSQWTIEWRHETKSQEKSLKKRIPCLLLFSSIYTLLFISCLLFNASVTINGEKTKLIDSFRNFFQSKAWSDFSAFIKRLWFIYYEYGWEKLRDEFINGADIQGLQKAYETLGLNQNASQDDISLECKKLSRKWHPDRFKNENDKLNAQTIFMDIQVACNRLSKQRRDKLIKNQQDEL